MVQVAVADFVETHLCRRCVVVKLFVPGNLEAAAAPVGSRERQTEVVGIAVTVHIVAQIAEHWGCNDW